MYYRPSSVVNSSALQAVKMAFNSLLLLLPIFPALSSAREIVFPSVSGYTTDQTILGGYNEIDVSQAKFAGLTTYANLPYVHCLAPEGEEVEKFDIAILGAPFDTVSGKSCITPVKCVYPRCVEGNQLSTASCWIFLSVQGPVAQSIITHHVKHGQWRSRS
jgi:hypothetical protein